jgi:hypothetical protein
MSISAYVCQHCGRPVAFWHAWNSASDRGFWKHCAGGLSAKTEPHKPVPIPREPASAGCSAKRHRPHRR